MSENIFLISCKAWQNFVEVLLMHYVTLRGFSQWGPRREEAAATASPLDFRGRWRQWHGTYWGPQYMTSPLLSRKVYVLFVLKFGVFCDPRTSYVEPPLRCVFLPLPPIEPTFTFRSLIHHIHARHPLPPPSPSSLQFYCSHAVFSFRSE